MERRLVLGPGCMGEMQVRSDVNVWRVDKVGPLPQSLVALDTYEPIPVKTTFYRTVRYVMLFKPQAGWDASLVDRVESRAQDEARETALQWFRAGFAEVYEQTDPRTMERRHWVVLKVMVPDDTVMRAPRESSSAGWGDLVGQGIWS